MTRRSIATGFTIIMAILILLIVGTWARVAIAQPAPGHDLFHQFYRHWFNLRGTHCCNERHCRPLEPGQARWDADTGLWAVEIDGVWRPIAATQFVRDDGGLGPFGSVCYEGSYIYCFDPPDATF